MHCTRIVSLFHAAGSLTSADRLANVSVMYLQLVALAEKKDFEHTVW